MTSSINHSFFNQPVKDRDGGYSIVPSKKQAQRNRLKKWFTIIVLVFSFSAKAQESMMPDVSYRFLNKLIDTAKKYYPKNKIFNHRVTIARDNVKKAQLSWFDLFTFSYSYSPTNTTTIITPSLTGYQFGFYFNIGNLLYKPHNIKQAREELAIAKLDKEEYNLNIEAEVKNRYFVYIQQLTVLKIRTQSSQDAESVVKQIRYKFEKGEETFENYNRALISSSDQKKSVIDAEGAVLIAKSNLEEIVSKKLEEIN